MRTILLTNNYAGTPLKIIESLIPDNLQLLMLDKVSKERLKEEIFKADYLLASGRIIIDESVLSKANKLRMIQRTGVGLDTIDLNLLKQNNIPLYVNQGINAESVAEHTLLLMLSCLRRITEINHDTHNGIWNKQEQGTRTHELKGKTVGIIGMGSIAKRLVGLLDGFGVEILYNNFSPESLEFETTHHMRFVDKEELLAQSDIITIHCSLSDETRYLINSESINKMKDGVILINTARGPIIKSKDLAHALKEGKVSFAGIDVHEEEPISSDYSLNNLDNVILTPHIGGITYESFYEMMHDAIRNIDLFDKGEYEAISEYRYL